MNETFERRLTALRNEIRKKFGVNTLGNLAILYKVNTKVCNVGADSMGSLMRAYNAAKLHCLNFNFISLILTSMIEFYSSI